MRVDANLHRRVLAHSIVSLHVSGDRILTPTLYLYLQMWFSIYYDLLGLG